MKKEKNECFYEFVNEDGKPELYIGPFLEDSKYIQIIIPKMWGYFIVCDSSLKDHLTEFIFSIMQGVFAELSCILSSAREFYYCISFTDNTFTIHSDTIICQGSYVHFRKHYSEDIPIQLERFKVIK